MLMPAGLGASQESEGLALTLGLSSGGQQKDTTWTKLFVGGLPYHTTDKSLREHFAVYGDIEEAVVITDRQTSKSRGYGFVIMGDRVSAERACKDPNPIIDGRKANVNLAILGAKPRGTISQGFPFPAGIRAGYQAVLPSQYGLPSGYMYSASPAAAAAAAANAAYLQSGGGGGLVQLPQLSHAAAVAAASQFYEYQSAAAAAAAAQQQANVAAAYQPQYAAAAANGFDGYPYSSAVGVGGASYVSPYAAYAAMPGAGLPGSAGMPGLSYAAQPNAQLLQEARMQ